MTASHALHAMTAAFEVGAVSPLAAASHNIGAAAVVARLLAKPARHIHPRLVVHLAEAQAVVVHAAADAVLPQVAQRLGARLKGQPTRQALEVGFGSGALLERLMRAGFGRVAGVDWASTALEQTRLRLLAVGLAQHGDLRCADVSAGAGATGLEDGSVDLVAALDSAAYWPDLHAGLRECHRVLAPGGQLLLGLRGANLLALLPLDAVDRLAEQEQEKARAAAAGAEAAAKDADGETSQGAKAHTLGRGGAQDVAANRTHELMREALPCWVVTRKDSAVLAAAAAQGFDAAPEALQAPIASIPGDLGLDLYLLERN